MPGFPRERRTSLARGTVYKDGSPRDPDGKPRKRVGPFGLGRLVATPGALAALSAANETPLTYLDRHIHGDWGDVDAEDQRTNDWAVSHGARILSAYTLPGGTRIWIITEADRSATTFLLPDEY